MTNIIWATCGIAVWHSRVVLLGGYVKYLALHYAYPITTNSDKFIDPLLLNYLHAVKDISQEI